jgi:hypothetical protein
MLSFVEVLIGGVIGWTISWILWGLVSEHKRRSILSRREQLLGVQLPEPQYNVDPEIMVKAIPAVNGRLLQLSTKKFHKNQVDWEWDSIMFIVPEDQSLSEAIATAMLMKGLEK